MPLGAPPHPASKSLGPSTAHAPPRRVRSYIVNSREIQPLRMAGFFARPNHGILGDGDTEPPGRAGICQPARFKMGDSYEYERDLYP